LGELHREQARNVGTECVRDLLQRREGERRLASLDERQEADREAAQLTELTEREAAMGSELADGLADESIDVLDLVLGLV
jgi:hypothetical protein